MPRFPFMLTFALATLPACDDSLSQWDRVAVQVVSGVTDAAGPLTVDAGEDIVTNTVFERVAKVAGDPLVTFQWESTAGGALLFGAPDAAATSIAAESDGTYTVRVTARGEDGAEGFDEFQLTWDATGPVPSNTLQTLAGSASGPDARVTRETTVVLSWGHATDAIVGVRDYTLTWYDAAACAGQETVVTGLTTTLYELTGTHGDVFSYRVTAIDELGQETASGCSPSIRIDTQAPPALMGLSGATGNTLGVVALTLDLPATVSDYDQVTIRRVTGATAPADCTSGTAVKTLSASDLTSDPLVVADQTNVAGGTFSYRVCIRDLAGNETGTDNTTNHASKHHYIFLSSIAYAPNFGGLGAAGADAACKTLAQAGDPAVSPEPSWRAMLSTTAMAAADRVQVLGRVTDVGDVDVAADFADLWDGTLSIDVGTDESGAYQGSTDVWTGTNSAGVGTGDTCNNWTDNTAGSNATIGDSGAVNGVWLDTGVPAACNQTKRIYCISQP